MVIIVNIIVVFVSYGWAGGFLFEVVWVFIMIVVVVFVGLFFVICYKDILYNGVFLWVFYGIYVW